jgi:hypothetical protein
MNVLVGLSGVEEPLERPRRRQEDNIEMGLSNMTGCSLNLFGSG